jgi:hypothetical protein
MALKNADGASDSSIGLEGFLTTGDPRTTEQDAFFIELGTVFNAPPPDVGTAYAELDTMRRAVQAARKGGPRTRDPGQR